MKNKIFAVLMTAILIVASVAPCVYAADGDPYVITEFDQSYDGYEPIPLAVIVVSFDPNENGIDDVAAGKSSKTQGLDTFGEQWAYSPESHWANICFGESGKSLNNFYKEMSDGRFYWIPVEETYGEKDNGIVYVTVDMMHPHARTGSSQSQYGEERIRALKQAAQYIDFAKYDKDGNGYLSYTEMSFVFIIAGFNSKFMSSSPSSRLAWGENCFEVSNSTWTATAGGVSMLNSSKGGRFCYVGEYMTASQPVMFGTIAHELGHVLGANDLYTYSGYTWCGGPGDVALQGGGSGNHYPGELTGTAPSAIDPYYLEYYGFQRSQIVLDGTYTLYSRTSTKGDYNILRVNTPDPKEYYLIENRYVNNTKVPYDGSSSGNTQGILIWHVDDGIMASYSLPNCYKTGGAAHAPGLTPLYANGNTGGSQYNPWDKNDGTFDATIYKFAGTEDNEIRWLTSIETAEEAGDFALKIEMLSIAGDEMQIKISGTSQIAPFASASAGSSTQDTITVRGRVSSLNGGDLTGIKVTMASDEALTKDVKTASLKPDGTGYFEHVFDSLKAKSTYYFKLEATGKFGTTEKTFIGYTKAVPRVRTEDYIVYLYQGLTSVNKPYEKTVKCGEVLTYGFKMTKSLQKFAGWYLDPEYTEKYDMAFTKTTCEEMYLYARWIDNDQAVTMKVVGATPKYEVFAIQVGEHFDEPVIAQTEDRTIVGWYLDADFRTPFNFDETIDEAGEITVYAKWSDDVDIPEETTTEETTVETTTFEATTSESTTESASATEQTTTTSQESTAPSAPGGCGSAIGAGILAAIISVIGGAAITVCKKK